AETERNRAAPLGAELESVMQACCQFKAGGDSLMNARWISRLAILAMPLAGFSLTASDARAQGYPNKPITFVVPYGPGSGNDVIARILANKLSENWGNPVMVVNRAGATGAVGLETTAKAAPDGYSIVIASTSQMINQH